jgi:hypothetical protein
MSNVEKKPSDDDMPEIEDVPELLPLAGLLFGLHFLCFVY